MNYNELSQTAHAAALKNGWYEKVQPINTYLMLIKSELYEALDAFRANKYTETTCTGLDIELKYLNLFNEGRLDRDELATKKTIDYFKNYIKDTFEDEIADTVIRISDFCGWYGIELGEVKKIQTKPKGQYDSDLVDLDILITKMYKRTNKRLKMSKEFTLILGMLESIAQVYNFDLEQHINLKLAYNATRGYKHGNKVL